jgi:hypothetical protein
MTAPCFLCGNALLMQREIDAGRHYGCREPVGAHAPVDHVAALSWLLGTVGNMVMLRRMPDGSYQVLLDIKGAPLDSFEASSIGDAIANAFRMAKEADEYLKEP